MTSIVSRPLFKGRPPGRLLLGGALVAVLALGAPTVQAEDFKPLSIESLARFEALTDVSISPDGKHIAGIAAVQGQKWPVISVWDASDLSKPPVWIPSATNRFVKVSFFDNDKLMFIIEQEVVRWDGRLSFTHKLYMSDLDGGDVVEPFKLTGSKNKEVRDALSGMIATEVFKDGLYDKDVVLLARPNPETLAREIYAFNKKTGVTRLVARESEKWGYAPQGVDLTTGEPMVRQSVDTLEGGKFFLVTQVKDRATGAWVDHPLLGYQFDQRVDLQILGFDADPNFIFVRSNRGRDHSAIYSYDLTTKRFSDEPLFANEKYDVTDIGLDQDYKAKKVKAISSVTVGGPAETTLLLDETWAGVQKALKAQFPGRNVVVQAGGGEKTALVRVDAVDFPPRYYLYKDGNLQLLGTQRPWIDAAELGKGSFITYPARDGLPIPAFVTYPPGFDVKKGPYPLVVLPHGGPWARDEMGWDGTGWPQFLATRGVVVIQPQYRGSAGWGDKLWKAGDGQWGLKMSDDNDDAAAYLVAQGIADPKRMAIFGYSYGGFAAIAASVRPNSPYRCAIAGAGVSSLERIGNLWGENHLQRDIQGHTVAGMDPIRNVEKANIPIMLYHGDRDRQADTDHSRMFFKAMKAAGKDVEYHEIKDMWHTLPWRPEWHTQTLTLIETYLKSDKCGLLP